MCGPMEGLLRQAIANYTKNFYCHTQQYANTSGSFEYFIGGYFNVTAAITELEFKFETGNIANGTIYGATWNTSPVIEEVGDVTINEDENTTITLSATDAEGEAITYGAVIDTNAVTFSISST